MSTPPPVIEDTKKKINDILGVVVKMMGEFTPEEIAVYNAKISAVNKDLDQIEYFVRDIYASVHLASCEN